MRQLHWIMMRSTKPIPGLADAPEIAIVVFEAGEKKIPAVRSQFTGRLRGRLPPTGENGMQTGAIGSHFPDSLCAILTLVHAETNGFAVRGPRRKMRKPGAMRQFTELRSIGMDGIEATATDKNDLASIR